MRSPLVRASQYTGTWYPQTLEGAESYWDPVPQRQLAKAIVCPHSAWMYSGRVAGEVYAQIQPVDTAIIVCPNHTGSGHAATSLYPSGEWVFPEFRLQVDVELAESIFHQSEFLSEDSLAHEKEHGIEVQLPFLALLNPDIRIVPILMRDHDPEIFHDLGRSIALAVKKHPEKSVLLIASTDLTHYESRTAAVSKDRAAMERIMALDPDGLYSIVEQLGITMCGVGPTSAILVAARSLGAELARLVRYATSSDVTHDEDSVVGYGGLVIH